MRIDIDTYREILDTLTRNKSRSFLTGFGVFWGVFMLVALIGGGDGLKDLLSKNFEGFATNSARHSSSLNRRQSPTTVSARDGSGTWSTKTWTD